MSQRSRSPRRRTDDLDRDRPELRGSIIVPLAPDGSPIVGVSTGDVVAFLATVLPAWPEQYRWLPIRANGGPAVAVYRQTAGGLAHEATAITLLSVRNGRIPQLVRFASPQLFSRFGLMDRLEGAAWPTPATDARGPQAT